MNVRFSVVGFGGTNTAFAGFGLTPWSERTRSQAAIQQDVQNSINGVAGVQAFVFAPPTLPGTGGGLPVQYVIRSIGDPDQVYEIAEEIKNRAQASGRFIVVQNSLAFDQPQALVTIDRDRAATLGVRGERDRRDADRARRRRLDLEVRPRQPLLRRDHRRSHDPQRFNPESLGDLLCAERQRVRWCRCPPSSRSRRAPRRSPIEQFNQLNSATISALPLPGVATGDALAVIRQIAARGHAGRLLRGFRRPVAARDQRRQLDAGRLRPRDHHHLPGARRAVRELPRSADHHADGADVDLRRAGAAQSRRLARSTSTRRSA